MLYGNSSDIDICTQEDGVATQIIGWLLTVGTVVSFVPQIYALLVNKNLDGLSALTWALNYLSNMNTIVNAVVLNWAMFQCCQHLSALKCIENLVPIVQLASPTVCTFIIFALTTLYSDRLNDKEVVVQAELKVNMKRSPRDFIEFVFGSYSFVSPLFWISIVLTAMCAGAGALMMIFLGVNHHITILYADIIGVCAVIFLMVMYIPQLYTTYKAKHTGSLSVATLLIQCPGSLAVVYFDAVQSHLSWTTWTPYLVSAIQQFVLILMCLYYFLRNRKNKPTSETDPLLKPSASVTALPMSSSPTLYQQERINN